MTPQQIWQAVLAELELSLSRANFITWFKSTFIGSYEKGHVIICVPGLFNKTWLEKNFHQTLIKLIEKITEEPVNSLTYRIETTRQFPITPIQTATTATPAVTEEITQIFQKTVSETANSFGLNPRYNFINFIVGKGCELAHAACQAITAQLGKAYNPLFIYGGSGLGKTHLLQAVGNAILQQDKQKKVVYATCEKFTNDFIHAVRSGQIKNFYDIYRKADLLLIDDIQFIAGKAETQEAFFNTFNDLHQQDKQIMITSDRPPKAISLLENRLLSRFEMGMIADVAPPDFETRMAILQTKCQEKGLPLEKEVLDFIANSIQNNVRELEGALNKLKAYHELKKTVPDIALVRTLVSHLENSASGRVLTPKYIIQSVAEFFDIRVHEVLGESREKRLAYPRQIIMFLMRRETKSSFPAIGLELGGRDHTTAMHACKKIAKEIEKDAKVREEIAQIRQKLFAV
ncbi:MAG: chromosomal replication initiator protein DnaA [Patescibacteria group bacterium]